MSAKFDIYDIELNNSSLMQLTSADNYSLFMCC